MRRDVADLRLDAALDRPLEYAPADLERIFGVCWRTLRGQLLSSGIMPELAANRSKGVRVPREAALALRRLRREQEAWR